MNPTQIVPHSEHEILIAWSSGERITLPYAELRYHCPCAACVDENTGRRTLRRESIRPDVRPLKVQVIGRYAIQFTWNDRHLTGLYPFDLLYSVCTSAGQRV